MSAPETQRGGDRQGQLVGQRYRVDALLDRGGQGAVYRGTDTRDGEVVAIKILSDVHADAPEMRERMFREAHALVILSGTCAVRVIDQSWTEDGLLALVLEWLDGSELETFLRKIEAEGRRLPVQDLVRLMDPIVQTLEIAHENGILHRDLKPGNIFVLRDGTVRLLDFGFAKFVRMGQMTSVGFVAGSPSYIAPEGWKGNPALLDRRIDVYGLAAVIFRCLAGRPPFVTPEILDLMKLTTSGERPSLHELRQDLPVEVDSWVQQALAIEPDNRFLRVRAMWVALRNLIWRP